MKKTFKLEDGKRHPDRIIEAIKHEVRKYIKREKKKALPQEADFWKFECKSSINNEEPKTIAYSEITKAIDEASIQKAETLYLEIIATEGFKNKEE
ncbi:DUF6172 family protein [Malaciobacter mytili]|uniref:Uncharacterized protein n=1 Tax=Malaciobacter mytili LMG 24559 TaxID=1032238 RepID=A0AAX2AGT3_9BACT|nr:DUF6172 family protein [Malaciobacter mytili]AXH15356.1 hypothetical protein AMYT_1785 [Malaciobacter mytili LMG 24559]RXI43650.1 hypothetical protein CRU99_06880 [Malaciobacter mytili]RXK15364.1 hypothetical protein CP985_08930 [Malaciobacter mytili LMG 24559]